MAASVSIFEMNWAPTGNWSFTEKATSTGTLSDVIRFQNADRPDVDWNHPIRPESNVRSSNTNGAWSFTKLICLRIKDVPPSGAIYNVWFGAEFNTVGEGYDPEYGDTSDIQHANGTWTDWNTTTGHRCFLMYRIAYSNIDPRPPFAMKMDGDFLDDNAYLLEMGANEWNRIENVGLILGPGDKYYILSGDGAESVTRGQRVTGTNVQIGYPIELVLRVEHSIWGVPRKFPPHKLVFYYDEV